MTESSSRELIAILENVSEVSSSFSKTVKKNNIVLYLCSDVLIIIYKKEVGKNKVVPIFDKCYPLNEIKAEEISRLSLYYFVLFYFFIIYYYNFYLLSYKNKFDYFV